MTRRIADLEAAILRDAEARFAPVTNAVLCYSGGLESSLLLDLLSPWRDAITVAFVNARPVPHLPAYIRRRANGWRFVELQSDPQAWIEEHGLPSSVVPLAHVTEHRGDLPGPTPTPIRTKAECCGANRVMPLVTHAREAGANLLIHGQRRGEGTNWFDPNAPFELNLWGPLGDWSREEVAEAVRLRGIELPQHFDAWPKSFDCAVCPAEDPGRLPYLAKHYPEMHREAVAMTRAVIDAVDGQLVDYRRALGLPMPCRGCSGAFG